MDLQYIGKFVEIHLIKIKKHFTPVMVDTPLKIFFLNLPLQAPSPTPPRRAQTPWGSPSIPCYDVKIHFLFTKKFPSTTRLVVM